MTRPSSRADDDPIVGPVLARIRADREAAASWQTARLLVRIERHLLDRGATIETLKTEAGVRGPTTNAEFQRDTGLTPGRYFIDCRMRIAAGLLRTSVLAIQEIADYVGYGTPQGFSRAYKRWSGETPRTYRDRRAASVRTPFPKPAPIRDGAAPDEVRTAAALVHAVQVEYRRADDPPPPEPPVEVVDAGRYMRFRARELWRRIRDLPFETQLDEVRHRVRFTSPELFELLLAKSREASDPRSGVERARLALASLDASADFLDDRLLETLRERAGERLENASQTENSRVFPIREQNDLAETFR